MMLMFAEVGPWRATGEDAPVPIAALNPDSIAAASVIRRALIAQTAGNDEIPCARTLAVRNDMLESNSLLFGLAPYVVAAFSRTDSGECP
jgi:hypothetical protein